MEGGEGLGLVVMQRSCSCKVVVSLREGEYEEQAQ
jgi:hypothetical protein